MDKNSIARRRFLKIFNSAAAVLAVAPLSSLFSFSEPQSLSLSRSSVMRGGHSEKKLEAIVEKYGAEFGGKEAVHVSRQKKGGRHGCV